MLAASEAAASVSLQLFISTSAPIWSSLSFTLTPRNMHYPPETSSIMLMARMVATVKQVRLQLEPQLLV